MEKRKITAPLLFALTCIFCMFGDVQGSSRKHQLLTKASCDVDPTMTNAHCFPPNYEIDGGDNDDDDDFITMYPDLEGKPIDEAHTVPDGTLCLLNSGHPKAIKCKSGMWINFNLSSHVKERLSTATGNKLLLRRKRWGFIALGFVVGYYLGGRAGGGGGGAGNNKPSITCPTITEQFTGERNFEELVSWTPATASDPEDGVVSAQLTQSPGPYTGVWLRERKEAYVVSYIATDSRGETTTCSVSFHVTARRCDSTMDALNNGKVSCSHEKIWGSTCTFTCDLGYELIGNHSSVTCEQNLQWSGDKPICREFSCPAVPEVKYGAWIGCTRKVAGADCTLVCQDGFAEEGNTTISCLSKTKWSDPGSCVDIQAPNFTCPADITIFSAPMKQPIAVQWSMPDATDNSDDVIEVTSSPTSGHLFPIGTHVVPFEARDSTGNSRICNITVLVEVKRCDVLLTPDHASVSCSHEQAVGSICSITCEAGFHVQGVMERTCLDTQQWSQSQPSCERDHCGTTLSVSNGNFACPNGTVFESICPLTCDTGYTVVGPPTTTCTASAQWTDFGRCQDDTPPEFILGCPSKQTEAARLGVATILNYDLPQAKDNSNGPVTVTGDPPIGSEINVSGKINVTAVATDQTGNDVSCIFSVDVTRGECRSPYNSDLDKSEGKLMVFTCPDGYVHGATCSISCSDNNPVLGGVTSTTCEKTGDSLEFEWFTGNAQPTCEDNQCDKIDTPENGATSCSTAAGRTVCALFCQKGYAYPKIDGQTAESFYCDTNVGDWVPAVIDTNVCIRGRPPSGQSVMPDIYYYDSECSGSLDQIKENFIQVVNDSSILKGLCGTANVTCDVANVTVTCEADRRRKRSVVAHLINKRQTQVLKAVFVITLTPEDPDTLGQSQLLKLVSDINDAYYDNTVAGKYDIGVGTTNHLSFGPGVLRQECDGARQVRVTAPEYPAVCVPCGKGYFFVESDSSCHACPVGTYQPDEEAWECKTCPGDSTTKYTASKDLDDCLDLCPAGSSSRDGREPCDLCPEGTYQPNRGQMSCDECPFGWTTEEPGATSDLQCQLYEWTMTSDSSTWLNFTRSSTMTILTFVRSQSGPDNTQMTFTMIHDPDAAYFGWGNDLISVKMTENTARTRRLFYHLALVHNNGEVTLYVDGQLHSVVGGHPEPFSQQQSLRFFTSGSRLPELHLHGLQIVDRILNKDEIATYSQSCNKRVESNLLSTDKPLKRFTTQSDCDVLDDCVDSPCGDHGTCIDLVGKYKCLCDAHWYGDHCKTPTNFCENHQCANGAECENLYEYSTYKCKCSGDYRGSLCQEPIVHGGWGVWLEWSICSQSCHGTQSRERACDSPRPGPEGQSCQGLSSETVECNTHCPLDGRLTDWSAWQCNVTCGAGIATRRRTCEPPRNGGRDCEGSLVEYTDCVLDPCPVHGNYTEFGSWSVCTKSCDGGQSTRDRSCTNPEPMYGGDNCDDIGPDQESRPCNEQKCPSCPNLRRRAGQSVKEEMNKTTDLLTLKIVCPRGLTAALSSVFCGPVTNWTWSHVTKDKPTEELPRCTNTVASESRGISISGTMYEVQDEIKVRDAVEEKARNTITCSEDCSVNVTSSRASSERKKRSTDVFTFKVTLSMDSPAAGSDLVSASDSEYSAQMAVKDAFQAAALTFVKNLIDIYQVNVDGTQYAVDMETLTGSLNFVCPEGYEPFDGFCVACGPGTFWSANYCEVCPRNQYQEQSAQFQCVSCPKGTSTEGIGSQSRDDCTGHREDDGGGSNDTGLLLGVVLGCVAAALVVIGLIIWCIFGTRIRRYFQERSKSTSSTDLPPPYRPPSARGSKVTPFGNNPPYSAYPSAPPPYTTAYDSENDNTVPLSVMNPQSRPFSGVSASGVTMKEKE